MLKIALSKSKILFHSAYLSTFYAFSFAYFLISLRIQNRDIWAESATIYLSRTKNELPLVGTGGYFELPQIFAYIYNRLNFQNLDLFLSVLRVANILVIMLIGYYIMRKTKELIREPYPLLIVFFIYLLFLHPSISSTINVYMLLYVPHMIWLLNGLINLNLTNPPNSLFMLFASLSKPNLIGFAIIMMLMFEKKLNKIYWATLIILTLQFYILLTKGPYDNFVISHNIAWIILVLIYTLEVIGTNLLTLPFLFLNEAPGRDFSKLALLLSVCLFFSIIYLMINARHKRSKKVLIAYISIMVVCMIAVSFNALQWNITSNTEMLNWKNLINELQKVAFTASWKYKLQYHIIDFTFLITIITIFLSKLHLRFTIFLTFWIPLFLLTCFFLPNYYQKATDPTVAIKWNPKEYLSSNSKSVCYPINPLPDWDFQVNPNLPNGWLLGDCTRVWFDFSHTDSAQTNGNANTLIQSVLTRQSDEYKNLILYIDKNVQGNYKLYCTNKVIKIGYASDAYKTISGFRYILFGFNKIELEKVINGKPIIVDCEGNKAQFPLNWRYQLVFPGY